MIKYYLDSLYLSLYSRKFYAGLFTNLNVLGAKYLVLLSFVISIPLAVEIRVIANHMLSGPVEENIRNIDEQIPPLIVKGGIITTPITTNQPITGTSGKLLAIIDVEKKVTDLGVYPGVLIISPDGLRFPLPESDAVMFISAEDLTRSLDNYFIPQADGSLKFTAPEFLSDMEKILQMPFIMIVAFATVIFSVRYMFSAFVYTFITSMFITIILKHYKFDFRRCFRIAAFTTTPVAFLEMFSYLSGGSLFVHASLIYFITHLIYIHFAVESYKRYLPQNYGKIL